MELSASLGSDAVSTDSNIVASSAVVGSVQTTVLSRHNRRHVRPGAVAITNYNPESITGDRSDYNEYDNLESDCIQRLEEKHQVGPIFAELVDGDGHDSSNGIMTREKAHHTDLTNVTSRTGRDQQQREQPMVLVEGKKTSNKRLKRQLLIAVVIIAVCSIISMVAAIVAKDTTNSAQEGHGNDMSSGGVATVPSSSAATNQFGSTNSI